MKIKAFLSFFLSCLLVSLPALASSDYYNYLLFGGKNGGLPNSKVITIPGSAGIPLVSGTSGTGTPTFSPLNLAGGSSIVTGTLPVGNEALAQTSQASGSIFCVPGASTAAPTFMTPGTNNQLVGIPNSGTGLEYKTLSGLNGLVVATGPGLLSVVQPANSGITNYLINGACEVFSRNASNVSITNANYCLDRWVAETSGATESATQILASTVAAGSTCTHAIKVTNNTAGATRIGLMQIVESENSIPLANSAVTFTCQVASSGSTTIRCVILENDSTADSPSFGGTVPRDPVQTWTSATFAKGSGTFFQNSAGLGTVGTTATAATNSSIWAQLTATAVLSSSCKNVIVLIWTDATVTAGTGTFSMTGAQLTTSGISFLTYQQRPQAIERSLCERYYQTSLDDGTIVTTGIPGTQNMTAPTAIAASTAGAEGMSWQWHDRMRAVPTVVLISTSATTAAIFNANTAVDRTGCTAFNPSTTGCAGITISNASANAIAVGNVLRFHWTADADI